MPFEDKCSLLLIGTQGMKPTRDVIIKRSEACSTLYRCVAHLWNFFISHSQLGPENLHLYSWFFTSSWGGFSFFKPLNARRLLKPIKTIVYLDSRFHLFHFPSVQKFPHRAAPSETHADHFRTPEKCLLKWLLKKMSTA